MAIYRDGERVGLLAGREAAPVLARGLAQPDPVAHDVEEGELELVLHGLADVEGVGVLPREGRAHRLGVGEGDGVAGLVVQGRHDLEAVGRLALNGLLDAAKGMKEILCNATVGELERNLGVLSGHRCQ